MLTIKNIEDTKVKEFSFLANEWILYGVDVNNIEYKFIFIPMEDGIYKPQRAQLVLLDRVKRRIGKEVLGYRLWTTDGTHTYVNTYDIPNWQGLVEIVIQKRMICI